MPFPQDRTRSQSENVWGRWIPRKFLIPKLKTNNKNLTTSSKNSKLNIGARSTTPVSVECPQSDTVLPSLTGPLPASSSHPISVPGVSVSPSLAAPHPAPPSPTSSVISLLGNSPNINVVSKDLQIRRAELLEQKKEMEILMRESAMKIHTYQKDFEVHQRAYSKTILELRDLDTQLSALSGVGTKEAGGKVQGKTIYAESLENVNEGDKYYWRDTTALDLDSDSE